MWSQLTFPSGFIAEVCRVRFTHTQKLSPSPISGSFYCESRGQTSTPFICSTTAGETILRFSSLSDHWQRGPARAQTNSTFDEWRLGRSGVAGEPPIVVHHLRLRYDHMRGVMETSIGRNSHLRNHPALASFLACIPSWEKPLAYSCRLRIAALVQMNRLNPIYKGKPASQDMTTKAAMVV